MHNLFNVCSNHTTIKVQRTRIQNTQFAIYISGTHVTLKQSQGRKTEDDNANPKQGYNHAKFERSCFNVVRDKANVKVFSSSSNDEICQSSPLNMCENQK